MGWLLALLLTTQVLAFPSCSNQALTQGREGRFGRTHCRSGSGAGSRPPNERFGLGANRGKTYCVALAALSGYRDSGPKAMEWSQAASIPISTARHSPREALGPVGAAGSRLPRGLARDPAEASALYNPGQCAGDRLQQWEEAGRCFEGGRRTARPGFPGWPASAPRLAAFQGRVGSGRGGRRSSPQLIPSLPAVADARAGLTACSGCAGLTGGGKQLGGGLRPRPALPQPEWLALSPLGLRNPVSRP